MSLRYVETREGIYERGKQTVDNHRKAKLKRENTAPMASPPVPPPPPPPHTAMFLLCSRRTVSGVFASCRVITAFRVAFPARYQLKDASFVYQTLKIVALEENRPTTEAQSSSFSCPAVSFTASVASDTALATCSLALLAASAASSASACAASAMPDAVATLPE